MAVTKLAAITCTASELGLTRVTFGLEIDPVYPPVRAEPLPDSIRHVLQEALSQIRAYLEGRLRVFDLPLDLKGTTSFQRQVLLEVSQIPYGHTLTYADIASKVGGKKHIRAVGGAVGSNPLPLIIPCHRVISTNGQLRGYSGWGGIRTKAWLLQLEGAQLIAEI